MIFGILEMFRNEPLLLFIITLGVACAIGGIPPIIERQRRRSIENDLPALLEALSDSLGAGLGLQQAMMAEACLLYTSPSPRDRQKSRMPSSA